MGGNYLARSSLEKNISVLAERGALHRVTNRVSAFRS
jgi:hypothetical protein